MFLTLEVSIENGERRALAHRAEAGRGRRRPRPRRRREGRQAEAAVHDAPLRVRRAAAPCASCSSGASSRRRCASAAATSGRSRSGWRMPDHTSARCEPASAHSWPETRVGAGHRDADGEAAAVVGVAADAAVLVPRDVGDALGDADRLEQRLDAVVRALACRTRGPAPRDRREVEEARVFEQRRGHRRIRGRRPASARGGVSPSAVRAHHERPSPSV